MARVALVLSLALGGLLGGAALYGLGVQREAEAQRQRQQEVRALAGEVAGAISDAFQAADTRARGLAQSPVLRAAVSTDEKTAADMAGRELNLVPRPGEEVEIFQLPHGRAPLSLLRLPDGRPPGRPPAGPVALALDASGGLRLTVARPLSPRYRQEELGGTLAITVPVDVRGLSRRLAARGLAAQLEGAAAPLPLSTAAHPEDGGEAVPLPLDNAELARQSLVLRAWPPRAETPGLCRAGPLVALCGLLAALALWLRARRQPAPRPDTQVPISVGGLVPAGPPSAGAPAPATPAPAGAVAASQSQAPLGPGRVVAGKYRLERLLGLGGMSEVYLSRAMGEARFEKQVAIKFLLPGFAQTAVLESFLNEARLQARLSHPSVVQIYDLGREGQTYFIAMEYVEGLDAAVLLMRLDERRQRVPLRCALSIVIFACEGLHAAHTAVDEQGKSLGLVHRDIKPSNILLGYSGAVKVADFGIAKAAEQSHLTTPGLVKGTVAYMAPEQRSGDKIDQRADVFGMGGVLYELCTGTRIDLDLVKLLTKGLAGWPHLPPPSSVRPDLPRELDEIVLRALAFRAQDRYPDCRALGAALEAVLVKAGTSPSASALGDWLAKQK